MTLSYIQIDYDIVDKLQALFDKYGINFNYRKNIINKLVKYAENNRGLSDAYNNYDLRQKTASSRIVEYTELGDGISLTVYDNGIKVYVNRNASDYTYDNILIPAYGFEVRGNENA